MHLSESFAEEEAVALYEDLKAGRDRAFLNLPLNQTEIPIKNTLFQEKYRPQTLVNCLNAYKLPTLVLLSVKTSRQVRRRIWQYLTHWSQVSALLNGNDLKALGYKPGPQYREILESLLKATLDGIIQNEDEAKQFLSQKYPI